MSDHEISMGDLREAFGLPQSVPQASIRRVKPKSSPPPPPPAPKVAVKKHGKETFVFRAAKPAQPVSESDRAALMAEIAAFQKGRRSAS